MTWHKERSDCSASSVLCLGIESSCDETSLALVLNGKLVGHVLTSQSDLHALFGGVVPEIASREHYRAIGPLFDALMQKSGSEPKDLCAIAVTRGPGLLGSLLVGCAFAKALALGLGIPLIGVNHLEAHLLACGLEHPLTYPAMGLLVSGGHTNIYQITTPTSFTLLGRTLDDAAGEAFDKVGNLLGLSYPSGKIIDILSQEGSETITFPLPYLKNDSLDFSFSGLKTAVATHIEQHKDLYTFPHPVTDPHSLPQSVKDLALSFSLAVARTLARKLERALTRYPKTRTLWLAGGVAANSVVRKTIEELASQKGLPLLVPSPLFCTDNGAMIAYAGSLLYQAGLGHDLDLECIPRGRKLPSDLRPLFVPKGT